MPSVLSAAARLWTYSQDKLARDRALPPRVLAHKVFESARAMALAPIFLRNATRLGARARTFGRPRIQNFGSMTIGDDLTLVSHRLPLELVTEPHASLDIGNQCFINFGSSIGCTHRITIGDRVNIGPYVIVIDSDFHELLDRGKRPASKAVHIEEDVWIGAKATIMPGVTIGRGAVVGTAAVVTRDVEPMTVVGGVPARVIQQLDENEFRRADGNFPG